MAGAASLIGDELDKVRFSLLKRLLRNGTRVLKSRDEDSSNKTSETLPGVYPVCFYTK